MTSKRLSIEKQINIQKISSTVKKESANHLGVTLNMIKLLGGDIFACELRCHFRLAFTDKNG